MDNKLCLWAARGATASELLGHSSSVSCVATSPTAQLAISGAYDRTLRVWDCSGRGRELACMRGGHKGAVLDLAWGRDAVISGGRDGLACLWDVERGELSRELRGHKGHVTSVTWAAETGGESVVISGAQDGCVRVWDTRAERCVATIAAHTSEEGSGAIAALAPTMAPAKVVEPIGGNVVVSAGADKSVCALDPRASWEPLHRWTEVGLRAPAACCASCRSALTRRVPRPDRSTATSSTRCTWRVSSSSAAAATACCSCTTSSPGACATVWALPTVRLR